MDRDDAGSTAGLLGIAGLLGTAVGLSIMWASWPRDDERGFGVLFGIGVVSISQLALLVAVIAWAVQLGIRWSGLASEISDTTRTGPDRATGSSRIRSLDEE